MNASTDEKSNHGQKEILIEDEKLNFANCILNKMLPPLYFLIS